MAGSFDQNPSEPRSLESAPHSLEIRDMICDEAMKLELELELAAVVLQLEVIVVVVSLLAVAG